MDFYLGVPDPGWLAKAAVPMFVSHRRLRTRKALPRALAPWALDSGGFSELSQHGHWTITPEEYVDAVRRYGAEIGSLEWAAIQDWMCEPWIVEKTGLSVQEHQKRTIANYVQLLRLAPEIPWLPVLQGWGLGDYRRHLAAYRAEGFDLSALPRVGVGSVCRRQSSIKGSLIVHDLADEGLRIHGFGFKLTGLDFCWMDLASADSMAWSFRARRERRERQSYSGIAQPHGQNDLQVALDYYEDVMGRLERLRREAP